MLDIDTDVRPIWLNILLWHVISSASPNIDEVVLKRIQSKRIQSMQVNNVNCDLA